MSAPFVRALARAAARRYARADRFARHFAAGKLGGDPVFAYLLANGIIAGGARILDLGCGQGVLSAWLAQAVQAHARGDWPADWPAPPRAVAVRGIDVSRRAIAWAWRANLPDATFVQGDIRKADFGPADVVVVLDVLHYLDPPAQERVLRRIRTALREGGLLVLRVGDADGSARFAITLAADRLAMALRGSVFQRLHCRPVDAWRALLEDLGFTVEAVPMSEGTPFANVLLLARYHPRD